MPPTDFKKGVGLKIHDLGLVAYDEAYRFQKECVDRLLAGGREALILCEHPAVLTLGRLAKDEYILCPLEALQGQGIQVRRIDRGGEVTLHCPGQLVVYPILDLKARGKDLKRYLAQLEEVAIDFLTEFAILADRFPGRTGVWCKERKIASIGIGVKKWVSFHGMAININSDLRLFSLIKPCGLDVRMTSVQEITGSAVDLPAAKRLLVKKFSGIFF